MSFRNADVEDANFILSLRTDSKKSRYLSPTSLDILDQKNWLENYARMNDQAYFIVEYQSEPIGTVRIYDQKGDSFSWGSWILKDGCPSHLSIETALVIYAYAVDELGFNSAHFDVRKDNYSVWKFHERFGAHRVAETELDYFYEFGSDAIKAARQRYLRFLPDPITVDFL